MEKGNQGGGSQEFPGSDSKVNSSHPCSLGKGAEAEKSTVCSVNHKVLGAWCRGGGWKASGRR